MKICFINNVYTPNRVGGAEKSVELLVNELVAKGIEVIIITLSFTGQSEVINDEGRTIYYEKIRNLYNPFVDKKFPFRSAVKFLWHLLDCKNLFFKSRIKSILRNEAPDVVNTNNLSGFSNIVWDICADLNIKVVHTLRDYYQICPATTAFKSGKVCQKHCLECKILSRLKKSENQPETIISISDHVKSKHVDFGFEVDACDIIPNGIKQVGSSRLKNHTNWTFGFMGRITEEKGADVFIGLADTFKGRADFVMAGASGAVFRSKIANSKTLSHFEYLHPEAFFGQIDFLICPTKWEEPFGRTVIEAFSYGIPVIVADHGAFSKLVDHTVGFKYMPSDEHQLIDIVELILQGVEYQELRDACFKRAKNYEIEHVSKLYLEVLKGLKA